jgi:hypothetical protein
MSSYVLRVGLLSAAIVSGTLTIANAEENEKSYLPPQSLQGKAEQSAKSPMQSHASRRAAVRQQRARPSRVAAVEPQQKPHRVRTAHRLRHARERHAYNQPRYFPFFLFPFNW